MRSKKFLAVILTVVMILALTACGGGGNKKDIVGTWHIMDEETATEYGLDMLMSMEYKLDGDTLIFDGATYTRVK